MHKDQKAQIFYHDIGDYLNREEKLRILKEAKSFANLPLQTLQPNEQGKNKWRIEPQRRR